MKGNNSILNYTKQVPATTKQVDNNPWEDPVYILENISLQSCVNSQLLENQNILRISLQDDQVVKYNFRKFLFNLIVTQPSSQTFPGIDQIVHFFEQDTNKMDIKRLIVSKLLKCVEQISPVGFYLLQVNSRNLNMTLLVGVDHLCSQENMTQLKSSINNMSKACKQFRSTRNISGLAFISISAFDLETVTNTETWTFICTSRFRQKNPLKLQTLKKIISNPPSLLSKRVSIERHEQSSAISVDFDSVQEVDVKEDDLIIDIGSSLEQTQKPKKSQNISIDFERQFIKIVNHHKSVLGKFLKLINLRSPKHLQTPLKTHPSPTFDL